ncbi:caprin-1-like [Anguilla anguilla]|uniref:caprin-1-like n=1 Tax=Anguilla anguilla TaxID=7936 RepID=UPI0015B2A235|nr:caprin-1-like [Anguilla anguilla]XP_035251635.1 caprin-1-like [Anguilla anguilla]XP_035251636.1 caprin-1-like [Anguilla anguilla]
MPSAMIGNRTVQSSSPDVGSAPVQFTIAGQSSGAQTEAMKQVLGVIDKKVRNMEKKKGKLDDYQAKKNRGERLNQDQLEALAKFQEVTNNLEFARELQKSFLALGQDIQKAVKKAARRELLQREEAEQKRLKTVLELQFLLDKLGDDCVRAELKQGVGSSHLLTDADLAALDEFYKLVGPERDQSIRLADQYEEASQHYLELLEGKDKAVAGTTYKALKETLDKLLSSGYFDRAHSDGAHQNGLCEEEEEEEQPAATESPEAEERPAQPEAEAAEEYTEQIEVESTEFVNRQFIPEASYGSETEQRDEWSSEAEMVSAIQQQQAPPTQSAPPPVAPEPHPLHSASPVAPADPVVRKQAVQDLMAQMQGPYNFMQDSMLEFDGQVLDPAIVSAQPMKAGQSMELPQRVCPPVHPESRLTQPGAVPVLTETTQVPMVSSTPEAFSTVAPLYQPPLATDPRPQTDPIDPIQASMALSAEQPPAPSPLPSAAQTQAYQPVSKPLHSGGINVNAAPFQSMQTVFNLNAPVPPADETDPLKQPGQYQGGYAQGFSAQTQHAVDPPEIQPDQLQSVVGAFHSPDQSLPSAGGPQALSQQAQQQGAAFGRPGQSFYSNRAMTRGSPRNSRGVLNGYRGPANGFRGGYDCYRPPFSNTPSSTYGQPQFSSPRDYPNNGYQRDGYQPNYKRGSGPGQGPRGCSRGRGGPFRPSRGMSHMTAQQAN